MIKQADVNLLAFPLEVETDLSQIRRDLEYYEEKIDPADGPAMSHSVLAVLYWRLGMRSKAFKSLEQSYTPNLRRPFCTFQRHHQMIRHIF